MSDRFPASTDFCSLCIINMRIEGIYGHSTDTFYLCIEKQSICCHVGWTRYPQSHFGVLSSCCPVLHFLVACLVEGKMGSMVSRLICRINKIACEAVWYTQARKKISRKSWGSTSVGSMGVPGPHFENYWSSEVSTPVSRPVEQETSSFI